MARKCFISFKTEDFRYKNYIQNHLDVDMIDKSLNEAINSEDLDYILNKISKEYLADSTVTIHLIGQFSSESRGSYEQRFIKRELQASLYNGLGNTKSGILGIVLPEMYRAIYGDPYNCSYCGGTHNYVGINDTTTIKEFSANYYIQNSAGNKCSWGEDDRYCVLVKWEDFIVNPEFYIERAFEKRGLPISNKTKVRPQ
ncbi:molecular chaperone Tir [Flavobacteriaceae bacterium TP-CH-4]|uniref:Molecular chaperone Tir n=1 Tax=Pelagihabitans pacificus TaxID=2696054 RepID=A0A967EB30_9FLAO|nr:TIR domain-containing protein [Pelagihabitans pacificus]NHF59986.1 molecular chaperone Tir [Pelagihabitans pacificus]